MRRPGLTAPRAVLLAALLLIGAGCAVRPVQPVALPLAQDAGAYHGLPGDALLMSPEVQATAWSDLLMRHFDPWERTRPEYPAEKVFWGLTAFADRPLYGENTLQRDPAWLGEMAEASRVGDYPSLNRRAIAVTDTAMRVLPTDRPVFYDPRQAGEGFPFDYAQNSLVLAGTPLLATHESADRAWVLVESRFAYGWVRVRDVAWVNGDFADRFRTGTYAAVVRDGVPLVDEDGVFRCMGSIGSLLPVAKTPQGGAEGGTENGGLTVLVPARDEQGRAVIRHARLQAGDAEPAPLAPTPDNFARLANRMLGQPYGWGGLYGDRDCSATTMDLMAAFGIFLPRNSSQQARLGWVEPLDGGDDAAKKARILEESVPFLTLVRKPGHIMLYIGSWRGEPVVLHTAWGLKTRRGGTEGRAIIGRTVITTLEPGLNLRDLARPDGVLLHAVRSLNTLP
ncbi:NLP/P60 protein [Pseudodesulfovibrio mercurii]|uniref:NLP/P60 protein n=1 Tax=Pseudodesulfovibrio mercurii TaxID=641491 RepID=F0JI38_9BACT|nr:SH3 domain-containing protein [Pseudodesulfovibrio mercurii]EGB15349.1 NLP/P60 protein [Pseudodesulfovibrio mercurii]